MTRKVFVNHKTNVNFVADSETSCDKIVMIFCGKKVEKGDVLKSRA